MARYRFSSDRKGEHPKDHLSGLSGWMHADGYAGFEDLYRSGAIREVAGMAHVHRKFARVHKAQGPAAAFEAIRRIADRYAVETVARGLPPDQQAGIRQAGAKPVFNGLEARLNAQPPDISGKNPLASTIRHALTRRARIRPDLDHGILEIDNNTAERAIRAVALGRKNDLFVGSQTGGKSAAIAGTLIETAKLNGVDPRHGSPTPLARIADPKINRINELLPGNTKLTAVRPDGCGQAASTSGCDPRLR